jgi:hypothetical protein
VFLSRAACDRRWCLGCARLCLDAPLHGGAATCVPCPLVTRLRRHAVTRCARSGVRHASHGRSRSMAAGPPTFFVLPKKVTKERRANEGGPARFPALLATVPGASAWGFVSFASTLPLYGRGWPPTFFVLPKKVGKERRANGGGPAGFPALLALSGGENGLKHVFAEGPAHRCASRRLRWHEGQTTPLSLALSPPGRGNSRSAARARAQALTLCREFSLSLDRERAGGEAGVSRRMRCAG